MFIMLILLVDSNIVMNHLHFSLNMDISSVGSSTISSVLRATETVSRTFCLFLFHCAPPAAADSAVAVGGDGASCHYIDVDG